MSLESPDLPDAIAFDYGKSIASGSNNAAVSLQRGMPQQNGDPVGEGVMGDESNREPDCDKGESELCAFMLEAGGVSENNYSTK